MLTRMWFNPASAHKYLCAIEGRNMARLPKTGELFDNRFDIKNVCSADGGMGILYFVDDHDDEDDTPLVLKCCKVTDEPSIKRFRRETRILNEFRGNHKIAQL